MNLKIMAMIKDVIEKEGGYVNNPADKGGPTNWGITLSTLEAWRDDNDLYSEDIRLLTKSEALEIYEDIYYLKPGINRLDDRLQPIVFDMAVNHGPSKAIKLLQKAVAMAGFGQLNQDGIIGANTINASNKAIMRKQQQFINLICDVRKDFYRSIVKSNPSQSVFLAGWINRANSFIERA